MIMLGIILMLIAVVLGLGGLWMTTSNNGQLSFTLGPLALNMSPAVLFVLGMVTVALLWLGAWMAGFGTKRSMSKRRERKQLEADAREQERQLAETNAKLGRERESAAEAERRREEQRRREAKLRVDADSRREGGREEEVRRLASERDAAQAHEREAALAREREATLARERDAGAHDARLPRDSDYRDGGGQVPHA